MLSEAPIDGYKLLLPYSRRGANRDLLYPAALCTYDYLLSSEAFAYQSTKLMKRAFGHYEAYGALGPRIFLGSVLTLADFENTDWVLAFPKRHRPWPNDKHAYIAKFHGARSEAIAVDRYGHCHVLQEGETVEPMDWNYITPMTITINQPENQE